MREELGLTGSKEGCDDSECGACMMLLDGEPVNSCSYLALQAEGREVTTVEGLAGDEEVGPLQRAFLQQSGVQCGFCTPGHAGLRDRAAAHNPDPTEEEIRIGLSGNLCRCTGYRGIVRAVRQAASGDVPAARERAGPRGHDAPAPRRLTPRASAGRASPKRRGRLDVACRPDYERHMPSVQESLASVPLFADLSVRQLRNVARSTNEDRYEVDDFIVREGGRTETLFVILEGTAKIVRDGRTIARRARASSSERSR